jgi:formyl-CoA transferase
MGKALEGVHILDFTHVQSGPTCTQLLAWFGADVIKVERLGTGDITRGQLRDIPNVDSLYFTMLNWPAPTRWSGINVRASDAYTDAYPAALR